MKPKALRQGLFVDPPATLLRKPTADPSVTPQECIAVALTCAQWTPGRIMDPDGEVVKLVMTSLDHEGWEITAKEAKRGDS